MKSWGPGAGISWRTRGHKLPAAWSNLPCTELTADHRAGRAWFSLPVASSLDQFLQLCPCLVPFLCRHLSRAQPINNHCRVLTVFPSAVLGTESLRSIKERPVQLVFSTPWKTIAYPERPDSPLFGLVIHLCPPPLSFLCPRTSHCETITIYMSVSPTKPRAPQRQGPRCLP